jgi:hypothetical protein
MLLLYYTLGRIFHFKRCLLFYRNSVVSLLLDRRKARVAHLARSILRWLLLGRMIFIIFSLRFISVVLIGTLILNNLQMLATIVRFKLKINVTRSWAYHGFVALLSRFERVVLLAAKALDTFFRRIKELMWLLWGYHVLFQVQKLKPAAYSLRLRILLFFLLLLFSENDWHLWDWVVFVVNVNLLGLGWSHPLDFLNLLFNALSTQKFVQLMSRVVDRTGLLHYLFKRICVCVDHRLFGRALNWLRKLRLYTNFRWYNMTRSLLILFFVVLTHFTISFVFLIFFVIR